MGSFLPIQVHQAGLASKLNQKQGLGLSDCLMSTCAACWRACKDLIREWLIISVLGTLLSLWRREVGLSNIILNRVKPCQCGVPLNLRKENGRRLAQVLLASKMYLVKSFLQSPTYLSAHLEHCSLYAQCSFKPIFRTFARFWETLAVKAGPLSDHKEKGNPNLGVYSWKNLLVTTEVVSISVGWTCTQPEEAYMKTNKNLNPRTVGLISVKSSS